ncbi:hypothetical protein NX722_15200 [Endozoicomonas gorgoniicola]|uniref:Uncharacterized protein n=1 Tax=Endozoicomonas gorgoniicola TaxID=1234144 RepID=A0ABT3MX49_9GAMM|nr:hypothetical protein [Endozoicomonas gorgoniicola]MCW7553944.1 hypothetical protein [Endozoicomonas gorgoniicola]
MLGLVDSLNIENDDAEYYNDMGINAVYVSESSEQNESGLSYRTPLESQLFWGACKSMAPFGTLKKTEIFNSETVPQAGCEDLQAYQYLVSRIYFWLGAVSLVVWNLFISLVGNG